MQTEQKKEKEKRKKKKENHIQQACIVLSSMFDDLCTARDIIIVHTH